MPLDKSAPGGRESSQENYKKPDDQGATKMQSDHGAVGQAQQNAQVYNPGEHSFKKGQEG